MRCQAAVETHFLLAEVLALGQRAEIQKAESERLLDLVGVWAGEEDDRDVCLVNLDSIYRMLVGLRARQRLDQCGEIDGGIGGHGLLSFGRMKILVGEMILLDQAVQGSPADAERAC